MTGRSCTALLLALAASAACASSPGDEALCGLTVPSVDGWTTHDEGDFTLQLPPEFTKVPTRGIDSQVGRWEAPGKQVTHDLGMYSNRLQPDDLNAFPGLVVCQEGEGRSTPRIIRYSPADGGFTLAAHWAGVRQPSAGMTVSLTLEGNVQAEEDLGEMLAIVRSVRLEGDAEGQGGGASDTAGAAGGAAAGSPPAGTPAQAPGPGYRAAGNEPFWLLTFGEDSMDFTNLGNPDTVRAPRAEAEPLDGGWRFGARAEGYPFVVDILDQRCSDSMSGRPFPHTVTVTAGGRQFTGCGGDTSTLLTGGEWRVRRLESDDVPADAGLTLTFGADGALTGSGGCNRFRATYEITGEGIEIGPALATRRACLDPEGNARETRFFSLLDQVTRFDVGDDGSLEMFANDRLVIVAQR